MRTLAMEPMTQTANFLSGIDNADLLAIVDATVANCGGTWNLGQLGTPAVEAPEVGYLVGGKVPSHITGSFGPMSGVEYWREYKALAVNFLAAFIAQHAYLLANGTAVREQGRTYYLGTWVDEKTGDVHIDISEYHTTRREAYRIGLDRGELAIWDLAARDSVTIVSNKLAATN
jgi:hypothetical protein